MQEIELGISNFDGVIDEGFAEALMESPGEVFGRHAGWNFNGLVCYKDGKFHEEVWVHHQEMETISALTLESLRELVCTKYGWA